MKITDMLPTKRDPRRLAVYVDGEYAIAMWTETVAAHRLHKDMEVSTEQLTQWALEDECQKAVDKACRLLGYRARSCGEIRQKLREKGFTPEAIDYAVRFLLERNYLDDLAFAREYGRSLLERGYGGKAIRMKLMEKNIDREIIDQLLTEVSAEDLAEQALAAGEKIWRKQEREPDAQKRKRRFFDGMYRRGFSYDLAKEIYHRLDKAAEHEDEIDS